MTELVVILVGILVLLGAGRGKRRDYERQRDLIELRELADRARYERWLAQQTAPWERGGPEQVALDEQRRELGNVIPWPINPRDRSHGS